jgi:beta-lactamase superfamily II metal-dependent hydrolase
MSHLHVTLIDVGWGDSILLEASQAGSPRPRFALIDSNDNADRDYWPAYNFLRKHLGMRESEFEVSKPFFDFVMLTHDHSDHGSGLKRIMKDYGTQNFWYPRVQVEESVVVAHLQSYVNHPSVNIRHQAVDSNTELGNFGDADMDVLWPAPNTIDANANNNSIVLSLTLNGMTILLTGDAEGKVWVQIAAQIPQNTVAFKVPHHGSKNGTIYNNTFPWVEKLDTLPIKPHLGISCHPNFPNRFNFPDPAILARFEQSHFNYCRTDLHYHITYMLGANGLQVKYSH